MINEFKNFDNYGNGWKEAPYCWLWEGEFDEPEAPKQEPQTHTIVIKDDTYSVTNTDDK